MHREQRKKAVLTLSGGLDSSVAAFLAADTVEPALGLTFDYGQKAARREMAAGYAIARSLGVEHRVVELPFFRQLERGALVDRTRSIPEPGAAELDDREAALRSAAAVWIPNRNGIFIAIAAAWAEHMGADHVVVGFNAEEAVTFPDNTLAFVERQNAALEYSTANHVTLLSPTGAWNKREIVETARARGLPLHLVWPCYDGGKVPCGRCESCRRFDRAVEAAGARAWLESLREAKT